MRGTRIALTAAALGGCIALCAVAAGAAGATASSQAQLRKFECRRALEPGQREVSVDAIMHPVPGTEKFALRFQLQSRPDHSGPFTQVRAGDLGKWISPTDPTTLGQRTGDVWVFSHPVIGLGAPASYRFRVTFRWTGAKGKVLATALLQTRTCFQPELRPDLEVQSVIAQPVPSKPDRSDYVAVVNNNGATGAGPFAVVFSSGGTAVATRTIARLPAHSSKTLTYRGPACSASQPFTVTVDPTHQVTDNLNSRGNSRPVVC